MNIDIAIPDDRARMISDIGNMIQSSLDERSIAQHAEMILDEYIVRTNHHIWLVGQCAKILRDIIISRGQDIEMFDTNVEFHDYDKTHNDEILPVYALACHYFYFHNKDVKYKVDEEWLNHEFEDVAWPKHHKANKHHYAEYYGKKNDKGVLEVPETYDILNLVEMYADWMAMGITNGGTAHEWWTKNYGPDNKFDFHGRDLGVIQECILAEDKAVNQLAYLRQFKDVEPTWVPPMEIETYDEVDPLTTKEVNEGIENFFNYESNEVLSLKRDDLFIGPIDPMCIDPEKMMKLAEYPDLLLALKKWTTTPDFNLAPQLTMLGKIVDDIYQFKNPITCYRGIRTGFDSRSNKKQNLMGVIDNDIEYLRLLKPGFDKAGTTFEYETQEPMSVARSPYIAKIYGNFIIKTEVPADANKLVITPELSYLLQQMEVEYPEYRAVNLSITHEVVVFSGTKLTFEIVSVFGDISSELETMKEHSFEGLGNTEMNGVYFNIFKTNQKDTSASVEALSTKEYTEADINSVEDLKQFYKHCSYGLIDFKANKPWKETHKNTTFEDWEKEWRLLSVEQLLKFKCGICYDTAKMNDYFLTKWKIDHVNLFAYTKRSAGDDYDDDPTHTFTVYKDTDGKWKWLEGSWGSFKNNDWSESSSDALIKNIGKALANAAGVTNLIGVITSWPRDGVSMNEFYHALKDQAIKKYKYEIEPDASYSKETLSPDVKKLYPSEENFIKDFYSWVEAENFVYQKEVTKEHDELIRTLSDKKQYLDISKIKDLSFFKDNWFILPTSLTDTKTYKQTIMCLNYWCDEKKYRSYSNPNALGITTVDQYVAFVKQYVGKCLQHIHNIRKFYIDNSNDKFEDLSSRNEFRKACAHSAQVARRDIGTYMKQVKSCISDSVSTESLAPDVKKKKQLIIDYICSVCDIMDPSKLNSKRYHRLLDSMSDKEFDQWMHYVKEGKWKIHIVAPNLVVTLKNENSLKAADKVKCKLFHRLWMTDDSTGRQYLTDNEYLVLNLPVRRQQQFLDEKMSVPDNDRQIDGMTGQVTGDSKSSAVTNPEIQILAARGLDATLEEFVNVRGGNIAAYSDFKRQAEETGEIKLNSLDPNTRSRVAVVGQVLLRSMMIENNILE